MGLTTTTSFSKRVYARKFDHEECARLRAEDPKRWTFQALAEHYGVSLSRIQQILNPEAKRRAMAASAASARRRRTPCLGGCGRLVWMHSPGRTGYCPACLSDLEASLRDDVREHELRCLRCGEWKPDEEFPLAQMRAGVRRGKQRRHKRTFCRTCSTEVRREFRERHPEASRTYERRYYTEVRRERRTTMPLHIVLKLDEEQTNDIGRRVFVEVGEVEAHSADSAIERLAYDEGEYVAPLATRFEVVPVAPRTALRVSR